jgi:Trk K+ transport system NAD-binding subunit
MAAAVLVRDDVVALRCALALAHLDPTLRLIVTIFDRTISAQLRTFLPQALVISPADLAVPSLAGPCLDTELLASFLERRGTIEVRAGDNGSLTDRPSVRQPRSYGSRIIGSLRSGHRHHDTGTRMLLIGSLGLGSILLTDWFWLTFVKKHGATQSFLEAARVVAAVGPAPDASGGYGVGAAIAMLVTIVLTALFTAGLVDRLLEPRLLGLMGPRTAARKDHVVVIGMGQVGVRLCAHLKALHIPVVGVERDRRAPYLPLARQLDIPVIIGSGTQRRLLETLRLDRSLALAAVGSDDLDNIAVAVAAAAVSPSTRVVLRAGEDEAIAETRSLLPLGTIRDVTEIVATFVVAELLGRDVHAVVAGPKIVYLRSSAGEYKPLSVSSKDDCRHA